MIKKSEQSRKAAAYEEAKRDITVLKEQPEMNKLSDFRYRAKKYKELADKLNTAIPYQDAAELEKQCIHMADIYKSKVRKRILPVVCAVIATVFITGILYHQFSRTDLRAAANANNAPSDTMNIADEVQSPPQIEAEESVAAQMIPAQYDEVYPFSDGLAAVRLGNDYPARYGFIDKAGNEIIPIGKYESVSSFSDGLAVVGNYDESSSVYQPGLIDQTGNEIVPIGKYESINSFSEGLAVVCIGGQFGFIDTTGKEVIPLQYSFAGDFSEGLAPVNMGVSDGWTEGGKWGFIDKTGKEVIPQRYDYLYRYESNDTMPVNGFSDGLAVVGVGGTSSWDAKWGVIDQTGREIIPLGKFFGVSPFYGGLAVVWDADGNRGMIDKTGKEIVPLGKYDGMVNTTDGMVRIYIEDKDFTNGEYGFIDQTGREITQRRYDETYPYYEGGEPTHGIFSEGLAAVSVGEDFFEEFDEYGSYAGKWGFIDKTGQEVVPLIYDFAGRFSEGIAAVSNGAQTSCDEWGLTSGWGGKWGFVDQAGNIVVPIEYDAVQDCSEGMVAVRVGDEETGKWGFVPVK